MPELVHILVKIHSSVPLDNRVDLLLIKSLLVPFLQPARCISHPTHQHTNTPWDTFRISMDQNKKCPAAGFIPGFPEGYVLCCWLMRLLAGLGYDVRKLLDTIRKVPLLTPAQLWGHQQLPGLVDAVFVLCQKVENWHNRTRDSFIQRLRKNWNKAVINIHCTYIFF